MQEPPAAEREGVATSGTAASADPGDGDPDMVAVWTDGARPWIVDRRTMRLTVEGDAPLDDDRAARAADLVDRAQLALGRPVEVRWVVADGRMYVASARELPLVPRFTGAAYRRVALMAEDEGTVAPLAVDAIDKALGRDDAAADEPRVRRVYARPYKRIDGLPGVGAALASVQEVITKPGTIGERLRREAAWQSRGVCESQLEDCVGVQRGGHRATSALRSLVC